MINRGKTWPKTHQGLLSSSPKEISYNSSRLETGWTRKLIFPAGRFPCKPEVDFGMTDKCQVNVKSRNHDRIYRGWESLRTGKKERKKEREKERMGVL